MSRQIPVNILSDSDSDSDPKPLCRRILKNDAVDLTSPPLFANSKKKLRTDAFSNPTPAFFEILDDTPPIDDQLLSTTPAPYYTPSFVAETPFSDAAKRLSSSAIPSFVADTPFSDAPVDKFSTRKCPISGEGPRLEQPVVADEPMFELFKTEGPFPKDYSGGLNSGPERSLSSKHKSAETNILICVDSDNESEPIDDAFGVSKCDGVNFPVHMKESELDSRHTESSWSLNSGASVEIQTDSFMASADKPHALDGHSTLILLEEETSQSDNKAETETSVPIHQMPSENSNSTASYKEKKTKTTKTKGASKEERLRLMEEKKQQKEEERLLKAKAAETKKCERERKKWEKGRLAVQSIVAEIDRKVIELGFVGGNLLTRFAEKKISFRVTSNPVEKSIVWNIVVPEEIAGTPAGQIEIPYVLIIYEAEEFCNIIADGSFMKHVQSVQQRYPHHTICYLTNRLMSYLNKREQAHYKNPARCPGWKRPAIEEAFSKLSTHFMRVHSRQCVDEAELAEHVVGLTFSLASCQFRQKLTRLSVNANGSVIPKDCVDKNLINKNLWLKALVAIPKVQPRFAMAIGKKYPTMKSLLSVYMDATKSVHEKEFLLKDLMTEGLLGGDRRLGEVCSKRIYRILMAESGTIKTDDVENGADFFSRQPA